ncbi:hypothetical protein EYF80_008562 [Liparis tanakae]|uniref:Uncharacterized protein n=1 Tax=Liparis tanakae TaxID=230148 RepID=A0A4Z2IUH7_9TELE|nr:hypothetical protein EYF80_008562 [Liparis tanakae]
MPGGTVEVIAANDKEDAPEPGPFVEGSRNKRAWDNESEREGKIIKARGPCSYMGCLELQGQESVHGSRAGTPSEHDVSATQGPPTEAAYEEHHLPLSHQLEQRPEQEDWTHGGRGSSQFTGIHRFIQRVKRPFWDWKGRTPCYSRCNLEQKQSRGPGIPSSPCPGGTPPDPISSIPEPKEKSVSLATAHLSRGLVESSPGSNLFITE